MKALTRLKLLKSDARLAEPVELARLCADGALEGGLSVALDVRPDELFGTLAAMVGGPARALKILDVRDKPKPKMVVQVGGEEKTWAIPDVSALVDRANELVAGDASARLTAVLGECEDALQLWCLSRQAVAELLQEPEFRPENRASLKRLSARGAATS